MTSDYGVLHFPHGTTCAQVAIHWGVLLTRRYDRGLVIQILECILYYWNGNTLLTLGHYSAPLEYTQVLGVLEALRDDARTDSRGIRW